MESIYEIRFLKWKMFLGFFFANKRILKTKEFEKKPFFKKKNVFFNENLFFNKREFSQK